MRHILLTKGLLQAHSERVYQGTVLTCVPQTTQISWLFHETVGSSVLEETIFSMAIYITVLSIELHGPVQQGIFWDRLLERQELNDSITGSVFCKITNLHGRWVLLSSHRI